MTFGRDIVNDIGHEIGNDIGLELGNATVAPRWPNFKIENKIIIYRVMSNQMIICCTAPPPSPSHYHHKLNNRSHNTLIAPHNHVS